MLTKKCQKLYAETKKLQSKKITKMRKFPIAKCQTAEKNNVISFYMAFFFFLCFLVYLVVAWNLIRWQWKSFLVQDFLNTFVIWECRKHSSSLADLQQKKAFFLFKTLKLQFQQYVSHFLVKQNQNYKKRILLFYRKSYFSDDLEIVHFFHFLLLSGKYFSFQNTLS